MDGSQQNRASGTSAVIGAGGFIGAPLVARLREDAFSVITFTRDTPFLRRGGEVAPELRRSDVVYYLASTINPAIAHHSPENARSDLALFARFLDALCALERPPLVVLPGSGGSVYHPAAPLPYSEDSPTAPVTEYGKAKLRLERELACRAARVPGIVLRLSNVYGPGQLARYGQGVVPYWLEAVAAGQPLRLYGDPGAVRDYIFIEDAVDAMRRVAVRRLRGHVLPEVLNIGSGHPTSLEELLTVVKSTVPGDPAVEREAGRPFDRHDVVLDVRRAASVLNWTCRVPLAGGIARTYDWHARATESRGVGSRAGRS